MAVTCPLCFKKGKQSKVKCFQINVNEAIVLCENKECCFPLLEGSLTRIVNRDFRELHDGKPPDPSEETIASNSSVHNSECSSHIESGIHDESDKSQSNTHTSVLNNKINKDGLIASTTSNELNANTTMGNMHTSLSEIPVFEGFQFTPPAVENGVKKKKKKRAPKRICYTGRARRKPNLKSSKVQSGSIKPEH